LDIPSGLFSALPHPWIGSRQEVICSYADFICPEDCPEPEEICTVTGKKRGIPLYELISSKIPEGFQAEVIRSRQLGPGVGGYSFRKLLGLRARISRGKEGKWLIGTACRCHGILSAFAFEHPRGANG
jgi:hypothetical protein